MISTHESDEAHQLGVEYGLGEPIRVYKVQLPTLSGLLAAIVILSLLGMFGVLIAAGFRLDLNILIAFGFVLLVSVIISLATSIPTWRARKAAVYICSSGFIMLDRKQTRAIRWDEVERVDANEDDTSCMIYLADKTSLEPNKHIEQLKLLATELKLKAPLGAHPERNLAIERQVEQFQNDPPWLQQARMRANLSKEKEQFLKLKAPEEAYQLGEECQLGGVLSTSRTTLQSLLLPNKITAVEYIFALITTGFAITLLARQSPDWGGLLMLFLPIQFILLRFAARQSRLHFYEEGFIYIQPGSIDVIRWEQVEKTMYTHTYDFFKPYCTIYLRDTSKIEINKYLNKRDSIKRILHTKTLLEETYPDKKEKANDTYIDIGHLAD